jgi:hypothetical protein
MALYEFKVVGVTFGKRQKNLAKLFNRSRKDGFEDYELEIRPYEYNGEPALSVLLDDLDVGNVAADQVETVQDMLAKCEHIDAEIRVNNYTIDDLNDLQYADPFTREEIKEDIAGEKIYSAKLLLYKADKRKPQPAPEPEPTLTKRELKKKEKLERKKQKLEAKMARKAAKRNR